MRLRQRAQKTVFGGRYRVTRELGLGATGTVFAAVDLRSRRAVAIKVLHPHLTKDEAAVQRFRRELQLASLVRSPGAIDVLEFGEDGPLFWIVMEYVEGQTLRRVLKYRRKLRPTEALRIAIDVASGLEAAHHAGVIHGDVKPENVLVDRGGRARLTDFSIARAQIASGQTTAGASGSLNYMAPESFEARNDARSDVYSFGIMLHEMLVGVTPFHSDNPWEVARQHREEAAPRVPASSSARGSELAVVAERCLNRSPDDRYPSGTELSSALRRISSNLAINQVEPSVGLPGVMAIVRHNVANLASSTQTRIVGSKRVLAGVAAAALMLGASASAAVLYWPHDTSGQSDDRATAGGTPSRVSGVLGGSESPPRTRTSVPSVSPTPDHRPVASPTQLPGGSGVTNISTTPSPPASATATSTASPLPSETPAATPTPTRSATPSPSLTSTRTATPTITATPTPTATPSNCPPPGTLVVGVGTWCGTLSTSITGHTDFAVSVLLFDSVFGRTDLSADVSTPNRESSLVFRAQDAGNGYKLTYEPNGLPTPFSGVGGMWLYREQAYQGTFLAYAPVTAGPGEPSRVRILADGGSIQVWLDGVLKITVNDSALSVGRAGLRIVGDKSLPCDATFTNISIIGDPP